MPNNNTDCTADFDISSVEPEKINSGFEFTLLTSNNSNLCKSYRTSKDGESFKSAAAALSQGNGTKVELENLKDWDSKTDYSLENRKFPESEKLNASAL